MRPKKGSKTLLDREEQTENLRSNVLVGRPISPESVREVGAESEPTTSFEGPVRALILVGAGTVCGLLLLLFGIYGVCTGETDLLKALVWPISACSGAVVLWASGTRGLKVLRGLGQYSSETREKDG